MVSSLRPPLVSVVIPTYNHARFLRKALDSVFNQTFSEWEIIIVNNYSDDDTIPVIESYDDHRIRYVNFANEGVIAASRNRGIAETTAPYIAFLDSDDVWYPQKLEKCIQLLKKGYDLVCHAETWVGPGERRRDVVYGPEAKATYDALLLDGNCISTSAVVVNRELVERVGGFSEETAFVTAEDYELWMKLAHVGVRIGFEKEILGEYLIHEGNQSRATLRNMEAVMAVVKNHLKHYEMGEKPGAMRIKRRLAVIYYSGARGLQDSGQFRAAWRLFAKALMTYPFVPRFYAAMLMNAIGRQP